MNARFHVGKRSKQGALRPVQLPFIDLPKRRLGDRVQKRKCRKRLRPLNQASRVGRRFQYVIGIIVGVLGALARTF